ncbi:Galactose oxidase/kelch repeat superfamily protein [Perilla frutescens var. hirtella]|uniref:Galactose oxidase/kelch repeat superfamily protein n=1 Tax=Perilla frutescens var. hirtella TaxID=608512 RepID=A0AAD4NYI5_PERFH|nr:Galactose oxidase/kelch repeat superfamily protein [Perilla frutescens var. hirtella]
MVGGEAKWVKLGQKGAGPGGRSSHAIAVVGQKVYAFGGEFEPRVPVDNHLYVFNLNDQTWSVVNASGNVPSARVGVTMASIGGTIYVFGGRDAAHEELDQLYSFETLTNTWTQLPQGPPHRSYHSMAVDERRVYVFGGCGNAGRLNDMWAYDGVDGKWIEFPLPGENCKPRGGPGLVAILGKIWVVYGFSGEELDDVHCFHPEEGSWVEVETCGHKPTARSVFSTLGVGKYIFVYGGEIDPSDLGHLGAGKFSGEVYVLDTEALVWERWGDVSGSDDHPGPRGWCAFAGVEQGPGQAGMLVYGGNSLTNDRLDDMFFFTPCFDANGN